MFVSYGSYSHDPGEVEVAVLKDAVRTGGDTIWAHKWNWELRGQLVGTSESDIDGKVAALEAAYIDDQDIAIELTGGGDTNLSVAVADTMGGIRVVSGPNYPDNRGAAYVTYLPYTINLEAIVPISGPETTLLAFEESITREGGGPRYGMLEPVVGFPVRQLLKRNTIFRATQTGRAVGINSRPFPANPLWPSALKEAPQIEKPSPKRIGAGNQQTYTEFEITWKYEFESATSLFGGPNAWGLSYGS